MTKYVLFLCNHNAGRSQMAQAFFNHLNTNPELKAISAGTTISGEVNPVCREAMKEVGIDMSDKEEYYPKKLTKEMAEKCDKVFTMGCNVSPNVDVTIENDLDMDDPAGKKLEKVRNIRDRLKMKIGEMLAGLT